MPPLLDVRDLKTWFPIRRGLFSRTAGYVRAVDGVSFAQAPGETLGLVGESGCGKSTLGRTVLGLERAQSGSVRFKGQELLGLPENRLRPFRRKIQIVFQDPFASLNPRMTVLDILTEGLLEHRLVRRPERREAAVRLLAEVGLGKDAMQRYPHEFSGGQRQRICIARALSLRPELIVCDEAVSALDVSVQAQVLNLLADLRKEHGLAYLFISHDLSVVRHIAHKVAVMYLGRLVETGPATTVIESPAHPYTRMLIAAVPRIGVEKATVGIASGGEVPSASRPPPGCRFHTRCPYAVAECRQTSPQLEPVAGSAGHCAACLRLSELAQ